MRLGQAHRARPLARRHLRQIARLEVVVAMDRQRRDRAVGQAGIHPEGDIGGIGVFAEQNRQERRQALAAIVGIAGQANPSALDQRLVSLLEALGGGHAAVVMPLAALDVANAVERLNDLLDEFCALAQHRLDNIDRRLGKARGRSRMSRSRTRRSAEKRCRSPALCKSASSSPTEKRKLAHGGRLRRASVAIRFIYELSLAIARGILIARARRAAAP